MRILVTGGAGFIGSHICDKLIELGHKVVCIDNLSSGRLENIQSLLSNSNFTLYIEDLKDIDADHEAFTVDAICHQAARGSVPLSMISPELYQRNNVEAFFNLINIAKVKQIKRFVYASSSSVYGDNTVSPKVESNIGNALSPYAVTKQINELYANVFSKCYGIETIGLRYFNVFGPRQNPNGDYAAVIPKFIKGMIEDQVPTINGDGSYSRDFTYIDNVVEANVLALTVQLDVSNQSEVLNIGAGASTSILELFNKIADQLQKSIQPTFAPFRQGDIPKSVANIDKATTILNYIPRVGINQGLTQTIKYFYEDIDNTTNKK